MADSIPESGGRPWQVAGRASSFLLAKSILVPGRGQDGKIRKMADGTFKVLVRDKESKTIS